MPDTVVSVSFDFPEPADLAMVRPVRSRKVGRGISRSRLLRIFLLCTCLLLGLSPLSVQAAEPAKVEGRKKSTEEIEHETRSELEQSLIDEALAHYNWQEEEDPNGQIVEDISVYVFEVFDERDPIPGFVNFFHVRTRDWVVEQEVLQPVGAEWDWGSVLETERNLRAIRQHSLANVVPVKGSAPGRIKLLVVVKDVWSLRLNSAWAYGSNGLDYMLLNPTEENLFGLRVSAGLYYFLERDRHTLGSSFRYPRIGGSRFEVGVGGGAYIAKSDGKNEGGYGSFSFGLPQYSRHSRWAYGTSGSFSIGVVRQYRQGKIALYPAQPSSGQTEFVPEVYESDAIDAQYWGLRSWGVKNKTDLTFGIELNHRRYRTPSYESISDEAIEEFEQAVLPVSDRRMDPYVNLAVYQTEFRRGLNIEALSIQEDYRLGHGISTTMFAGSKELGSSRNHVGAKLSAGLTLPLGDGLTRFGVGNRIVVGDSGKHEGFASARARIISPDVKLGRLHGDAYVGYRYYDYLNVPRYRLGGNNRLRGYPSRRFEGKNIAVFNTEFRTVALDILSAQIGLAAFYDVGAVNDDFSEMKLRQGLGTGVRILFAQAERVVLRFDWAVPLNGEPRIFPGAFFFTFGQAFPVPSVFGGGEPFVN